MNFKIDTALGARFKLIARKRDGSIARETCWFLNKVLTTGLNRMSAGGWINRCCVGSGNSTPLASQTALDSFIASTTAIQSTSSATQLTVEPIYYSATNVWRFAEGVAAGNISEVGMGWANTSLWNRALVKDLAGNPTTLTVLSDEVLDVVAEIRVYPKMNFTGSFQQLDKLGNVLQEHTYVGKALIKSNSFYSNAAVTLNGSVYPGVIASDYVSNPSGASLGFATPTVSNPTSTSIKAVFTLALNASNGVHQSFAFGTTLLNTNGTGYAIQISPPFTKTAAMKVTYTVEFSWSEYTGG